MQDHVVSLATRCACGEAEAIGGRSDEYAGSSSNRSIAIGGLKHERSASAIFAANKMLAE